MVRDADHAAFRAPKGDAHNSAFPGHPHSEGTHFIKGNFGAKADAAFCRAAIDVVQHAVSGEHLNIAVVHAHRKIDNQFAFGFA